MGKQNYQKKKFKLVSKFEPAGDQGTVIKEITDSMNKGDREQTIFGVTGSGKTYMMAKIIEERQRPTLILAHNKTLAAQLAEEFQQFFPENAVQYFVSYYDYYQPESYVPSSDTYIEKQTDINEEIEKYRLATVESLLTRSDVIIVASVSAIYGLGDPDDFLELSLDFKIGQVYNFSKVSIQLINMQFSRSQGELTRGQYRIQGDVLEIVPAASSTGMRFEFFGDELEDISEFDLVTGKIISTFEAFSVFPANPFVTSKDKVKQAVPKIRQEALERVEWFEKQGRFLEAQRVREKAERDTELLDALGFVAGIENYSPILENRLDGTPPSTLIDFFPTGFNTFIDESHITLPQIGSMYLGDRSRKENLINYGFRLPSALHNRPLKIDEFFQRIGQVVYVSATPSPYELGYGHIPVKNVVDSQNLHEFKMLKNRLYEILSSGDTLEFAYKEDMKLEELVKLSDSLYRLKNIMSDQTIEEFSPEIKVYLDGLKMSLLLEKSLFGKRKKKKILGGDTIERDLVISKAFIRPTGLLDPEIILSPVKGQVDDVLERVREAKENNERVLITTLTKKFAEELDLYFKELGVKSTYIHFGVSALERQDIIADLRRGTYDVLIGINLLREGLDIPEVSMVAIFDADKEGFLRSKTSLIQTIGRAARNANGRVIMYGDNMTDSMRYAIKETENRRKLQMEYNLKNGIVPKSTVRKSSAKRNISKEDEPFLDDKIPEDYQIQNANKISRRAVLKGSDQAHRAFEVAKDIWTRKLGNQDFEEKDLRKDLKIAIKEMNFEKASAIKDLLDSIE